MIIIIVVVVVVVLIIAVVAAVFIRKSMIRRNLQIEMDNAYGSH